MTVPIRYLTIPRFAEETGYTEDAIRTKIRDGVWREGGLSEALTVDFRAVCRTEIARDAGLSVPD